MTTRYLESIRVLAETTERAPYLAYEVVVDAGTLLPTGRTLPIVADSRSDAGAQLRTELRAFGERPFGTSQGSTVLWVGESRYWLVDKDEAFPNAPAEVDAIWLHRLCRSAERRS